MALPNARNQYLKTQIETASKEQLVVMLFDGIVRFTEQARKAIESGVLEDSHHALMRAQAIIMELICTIDKDKGGEVANNLMSLHAYAFNCLIVCNMKKDVSKIDEVQKIYRELRDAWVGAMDTLGISSNAGKPIAAPTGTAPANPGAGIPKAPPAAMLNKPAAGPTGSGYLASAAQAPAASLQPLNAAAGPALTPGLSKTINAANAADGVAAASPAMPKATGYGMGQNLNVAAMSSAPAAAPIPQATGYGMGKTAMLNSLMGKTVGAQPSQTVPGAAKQGAVLNAYGNGTRSIA